MANNHGANQLEDIPAPGTVLALTMEIRYLREDIVKLRDTIKDNKNESILGARDLANKVDKLQEHGTLAFEQFKSRMIGAIWAFGGLSGLGFAVVAWLFLTVLDTKQQVALHSLVDETHEKELIKQREDLKRLNDLLGTRTP